MLSRAVHTRSAAPRVDNDRYLSNSPNPAHASAETTQSKPIVPASHISDNRFRYNNSRSEHFPGKDLKFQNPTPLHLPLKVPPSIHTKYMEGGREIGHFSFLGNSSATCICRSLTSRSGTSHLPHCTQNGPMHCFPLSLFMQARLHLDKFGEGKCMCCFGAVPALWGCGMFFFSFVVVCLWCGAGAGRRRAEPLRNQVSESCYRGRDKMQTHDMRRHCECMVLGYYLHCVRMITPPSNSCLHDGWE